MCLLGNKFRAGNPPFKLLSVHVLLFIRGDLSDCFRVFYWLPQSKSELYLVVPRYLWSAQNLSLYVKSLYFSIYKTSLLSLLLFLEMNVVCHVTLQSCRADV